MKELKDYLHLYLGCEAQLFWRREDDTLEFERVGTLESIRPENKDTNGLVFKCKTDRGNFISYAYAFNDVKLILRSLSDMTEEEAIEICKIYAPFPFTGNRLKHWAVDRSNFKEYQYLKVYNKNNQYEFQIDCKECCLEMYNDGELCESYNQAYYIKYLLSKHFDLFGLIEAGLAIGKTKNLNNQ